MSRPIIPVLQSIYICDDVIQEPRKQRIHLIGLFDEVRLPDESSFPYQRPQLCVFVRMNDAVRSVPVRVEVVRSDTSEIVFETQERPVHFPDRNTVVSVCFRIQNCEFPVPGVYYIQLYCVGEWVQDKALRVLVAGSSDE